MILLPILLASIAGAVTPTEIVPVSQATNSHVVLITPEFIDALSEELRGVHPGLRAARSRTLAADNAIRGVRKWEDPEIMVGGEGGSEEMRAEEGDIVYGVEQKLPLFGKQKLARQLAEAERDAAQADTDLRFQELRRELAKTLFQAALAQRLTEIEAEDHAWIGQMIDTLTERYRNGDTTQLEVLRLQNESSVHLNRLRAQRSELDRARVKLNRQLNRPLESNWPKIELPLIAQEIRYDQRLVSLAVRHEPKLKLLRQETRRASVALEQSRRQYKPDVSVTVEGRTYSGTGDFRQGAVLFGFNLPFANRGRYRADIAREDARLEAAEAEAADYELSVQEEVRDLITRIENARREAANYLDDIIPRAEQALVTAQAVWGTSSRVMFRDVLEVRRQLLEARTMYARAITEQYLLLSELVLCCGLGDFRALEMIHALPSQDNPPSNTP